MSTYNPFAPLRVVRINKTNPDPALDLEPVEAEEWVEGGSLPMDVESYAANRRNVDLVKVKDGARPDWFTVNSLSPMRLNALKSSYISEELKFFTSFNMSCHLIERADGTVMKPAKFNVEKISGQTMRTPDESWLKEVMSEFGYDTILEIGQVAIQHAGLAKDATGPFTCWVGTVASP